MRAFTAQASGDLDAFLSDWRALESRAVTPFQRAGWLQAWYATLGREPGVEPLLVTVKRGNAVAMLLPLVVTRSRGLRIACFADADVTDYNAPLLADAAPADATPMWQAVRDALTGVDLLRIDKMLATIGAHRNPLAIAMPTQPCELFGNFVVVPDDWDAWRHTLDKTVRKEFERTGRVFERIAGTRFERITDLDAALATYLELEAQQRLRMAHAGDRYRLDRPAYRRLYEERLRDGIVDGTVVLTTLRCRDELVAALYGISDGPRYVALRISHAGDAWKHCAPGKLLLERTMHHLHGQGLRHFDFAIGDYFHKRVFKVAHTPLVDACVALSWRGVPQALAWQARRVLKRQAWLVDRVRRLRGSHVRASPRAPSS